MEKGSSKIQKVPGEDIIRYVLMDDDLKCIIWSGRKRLWETPDKKD